MVLGETGPAPGDSLLYSGEGSGSRVIRPHIPAGTRTVTLRIVCADGKWLTITSRTDVLLLGVGDKAKPAADCNPGVIYSSTIPEVTAGHDPTVLNLETGAPDMRWAIQVWSGTLVSKPVPSTST